MAKKKRNKKSRRNYKKQTPQRNVQYDNGQYENSGGKKKINKATIWIIVISLLVFVGIYFLTGGFYAKGLKSWQMDTAWFCPVDKQIYTGNKNALITRDFIDVKKNGETLVIALDAEKIDIEDRLKVSYNVVYYKDGKVVGCSEAYKPIYDKYSGEDSYFVVWEYENAVDVLEGKDVKALGVDSVKIAVLYDNNGEAISLLQRSDFSEAVRFEYGEIEKEN